MTRRPPRSTLFPTRRSSDLRNDQFEFRHQALIRRAQSRRSAAFGVQSARVDLIPHQLRVAQIAAERDRKSTRLNSSHSQISYAVFCLKKKKKNKMQDISTTA